MSDDRTVHFVDTTLRDGHASLWAEAMRTAMMLPAAPYIDRSGAIAAEIMATSHFKKAIRELREDPWERIRQVSARMPTLAVTALSGRVSTFNIDPVAVRRLWIHRLAANGIRRTHLMHPSNDMHHLLEEEVQFTHEVGIPVVVALVYSLSPKHTDEYYAQKTRDAVGIGADRLYLKDPGGLLTPERVRTLVPVILANANGTPVELHSHCTTGLAPLCYLEAIKQGIRTVHTAIPPLANGSSQPSVFNVVENMRTLGYTPAIDEDALRPVSEHFHRIARRENLPIGKPLEYDYTQYVHQVPGGVISNLKHQLKQMSLESRLQEALEESIRVRHDLGYPIMVTPFSQFVVSQAVINMLVGERYQQVTDELIKYVAGHWGKDASDAIDPDVSDRILSTPRARALADWQPPEPSIEDLRQRIGFPGISDDELLLRYLMRGTEEIRAMREAVPRSEHDYAITDGEAERPLVALIRELTARPDRTYVSVQKGTLSVTLARST